MLYLMPCNQINGIVERFLWIVISNQNKTWRKNKRANWTVSKTTGINFNFCGYRRLIFLIHPRQN
jgi:hypothetical protein